MKNQENQNILFTLLILLVFGMTVMLSYGHFKLQAQLTQAGVILPE